MADRAAIRHLFDQLTEGWNKHDGNACTRPFAAEADFTNVMGFKAHDKELIARGHDEIFSSIFRNARIG